LSARPETFARDEYTVFYASLYCTRSCPGVLLAKKRIFKNATPSCVGGGVVEHVSQDGAIWVEVNFCLESGLYKVDTENQNGQDIETREEAGTPDIVGAIRCGLVFTLVSTRSTTVTSWI
jgi:selenocysteine lyase/cysteine desulfurase